LIGDDIGAICKKVEREKGISGPSVSPPAFAGTKKNGYVAACEALFKLVGTGSTEGIPKQASTSWATSTSPARRG